MESPTLAQARLVLGPDAPKVYRWHHTELVRLMRTAVDTATEAETCLFLPTRGNPNRPTLRLAYTHFSPHISVSGNVYRHLAIRP
jgi:hypothetical protein